MKRGEVAIVVIGRNEGARLERCLKSIDDRFHCLYVDSGSSDGSVALAAKYANDVIELDAREGFTAARARNAGWQKLAEQRAMPEFIQFLDGDCEMEPGWLESAMEALRADRRAGVVFGRLRERYPDKSVYNRMCDTEWRSPIGLVPWCGGIAMLRSDPLVAAGGYNPEIIAGEEPDLCLRLGKKDWLIKCIDHPMAIHDAAMLHWSQWWKRSKRSGHAYLEHLVRHRSAAFPQWRRQVFSILFWAAGVPASTLICAWFSAPNWTLVASCLALGALIYVAQIARMTLRKKSEGSSMRFSLQASALTLTAKFAELSGMVLFLYRWIMADQTVLIEHKQ